MYTKKVMEFKAITTLSTVPPPLLIYRKAIILPLILVISTTFFKKIYYAARVLQPSTGRARQILQKGNKREILEPDAGK